ncbi:MAG TPA: siderophore-interacting protein [Terrimesophilobacter sp.]|nr:siderophore-interacting protein [Terrimesophilobacter sp.]
MIERGQLVRHEVVVRNLAVARTKELSPGLLRVTLQGEQLDGFTSLGAADHVKLLFSEGVRRDYTPRAFRPAADGRPAELDLDFFLHGDGPASSWAASATEGDVLSVAGPRGSHLPPTGARRVILGADESALPAVARWIELLPEETEIFGFVELDNPSDAAYLDPDHVHKARVVWLGKAEGALERAIRALGPIGDDTFVWVAGEATTLIPIRRYLRRELGLPPGQVKIDGYWKRGEAGRDHHAPIDPSDPED